MFEPSKKQAASFIELLIILMLVGILSVIYNKTVDKNAIITKFAYQNLLDNLTSYTITKTENYTKNLPDNLCEDMFATFNTIGEANCDRSYPPCPNGTTEAIGDGTVNCVKGGLPNFVTTNGMRFYGLEKGFQDNVDLIPDYDAQIRKSIIFDVDLDGIYGNNDYAKDIMAVEIIQNGKVRPAGLIATDPKLYAASAMYVYDNRFVEYTDKKGKTQQKNETVSMGNRLSYAEAQCLSGNYFPYRDRFGQIQLCIKNSTLTSAITTYQNSNRNSDAVSTLKKAISTYKSQATQNSICSASLYGTTGVASGLEQAATGVYNYCKKCYGQTVSGIEAGKCKISGASNKK